jgi:hypothetical protein
MPELPGPPADYSDEQKRAWRAGAATVARILSQQGSIIADAYAPDDGGDDEDGTCPECGADLVEAFGGGVCPDCDFQEDD